MLKILVVIILPILWRFWIFNLIQHVNFPTHRKGHTLDLVCTAGADINQLEGKDLCISDHQLLSFNLSVNSTKTTKEGYLF